MNPSEVTVRPPGPQDPEAISALYADYLAELVGFGASYRLDAEGVWQPNYLPYWLEPHGSKRIRMIEVGGQLAGLAFIGRKPFPYMTERADQRLVEFYVSPDFRQRGVGARAAMILFDELPGRWELSQLPGNAPAIRFWRAVLGAYTGGTFEECVELGLPTQRFLSRTRR